MEGVQDLGGLQGFGPMPSHHDERPFHAKWEPVSYAVALLAAEKGMWTFDAGRHAIERLPARQYIGMTYFERVLAGMITLAVETGAVSQADLEARAGGPVPVSRPLGEGEAARRDHPGFEAGDRVKVKALHTAGHTRAPRYIQGKEGTVLRRAPLARFPGEAGHLQAAQHEPTYHVCFEAASLWSNAELGATVVVDVYQSYLDRA
ncbi:Nitrile hydratase subunit beta [Variovorax sp. SRS16]|uniref:nitrile hydratase subunit beta n=1 Tax=Variovorax sp. SRS16 TaxID=282217 RepID=UPI00131946D6|nr:nitrile hydratase subunit beta [Variovorax sp. SRS16]VTU31083.1 Nitrile hydratase subunit beta [Variovorax sp. SRS16]